MSYTPLNKVSMLIDEVVELPPLFRVPQLVKDIRFGFIGFLVCDLLVQKGAGARHGHWDTCPR